MNLLPDTLIQRSPEISASEIDNEVVIMDKPLIPPSSIKQ